jgi:hypothetical protein
MDPNLTQPIILNATLNATLIQSPQSSIITPIAAAIGAIAALIGALVSSLTYYFIEKKRSESTIRMHIRDERKENYKNLLKELYRIEMKYDFRYLEIMYLGKGAGVCFFKSPENEWDTKPKEFFYELSKEIESIKAKFEPEIEAIGDLRITELLDNLDSLIINQNCFRNAKLNKENIQVLIELFSEIKNIIRSELVPISMEAKKRDERRSWK